MNITPKRRDILQRIHDAPGKLTWTHFAEDRQNFDRIASLFQDGLVVYQGGAIASYFLTDAGRQALHEAGVGNG